MAVDYVDGLESCYYFESCDECLVDAVANGEQVTGTCDEMMEMFEIPEDDEEWYFDDEEWYYDDEECSEEGETFDCFDMTVDYVDGLESCYYFESCDECIVDAVANGESVSGTCDEMMEMYEIPEDDEDWYYDDEDMYYDDEDLYYDDEEESGDCVDIISLFVENLEECYYTETEDSCWVEVVVDGEAFEGDCDEMMEEFDIDEEEFEAASDMMDYEDYSDEESEVGDCYDVASEFVEGLDYCFYVETEDDCQVEASQDGRVMEGSCEEMMEWFEIPEDAFEEVDYEDETVEVVRQQRRPNRRH